MIQVCWQHARLKGQTLLPSMTMKEQRRLQDLPCAIPRLPPSRRAGLTILFLVCLVSIGRPQWPRAGNPVREDDVYPTEFSFDRVSARPYLEYTSCFHGFQCARLELPMDYWNDTTNSTIELAVIRRPAAVPITHPQYGGPILLNPGGPGGSGVGFALDAAEGIRKTVDSESGKYFDIMSFDPRGVGATRPPVRCAADEQLGQSFALRVMEEGILGSSDASFGRLWSMAIARSRSCSLPPREGTVDFKKYVNTAFVARDMVELVEAHGAWREKEATRLLASARGRSYQVAPVPVELRHKMGEEKISYWGFSYGSYLGLITAAMFPERILRLVADGVVDAYDYRKTLWYNNLLDTEKELNLLYHHCARVGYPTCALGNATGDTTFEGVKERAANILSSLYHNPLPVISATAPEVVQYSDVKRLIFIALKNPIVAFPAIATVLADLESGNGSEVAKRLRDSHRLDCPHVPSISGCDTTHPCRCAALMRTVSSGGPGTADAAMAISCTDGDDQSWLNHDEFKQHFQNLTRLSPAVGAIWAAIRLQCVHFSVRPHFRFTGEFKGDTSHPILLIGNTADPVSPLAAATELAKSYEGAIALTQNSTGHTSLAAPSVCTRDYVRRYFQTGELPPNGTVCEVDQLPFGSTHAHRGDIEGDVRNLRTHLAATGDAIVSF